VVNHPKYGTIILDILRQASVQAPDDNPLLVIDITVYIAIVTNCY
jgi:hypothetical protein